MPFLKLSAIALLNRSGRLPTVVRAPIGECCLSNLMPNCVITLTEDALARISHTPRGNVAHALLRAVSRLISTPSPASNIASSPGVGKSADAARRSACATARASNVCEKCALEQSEIASPIRVFLS